MRYVALNVCTATLLGIPAVVGLAGCAGTSGSQSPPPKPGAADAAQVSNQNAQPPAPRSTVHLPPSRAYEPPAPSRAQRRALAILAAATSVETYRLDPEGTIEADDPAERRRRGYRYIEGYRITGAGPTLGREDAKRLATCLADRTRVRPPDAGVTGCVFEPGVAFRLRSPDGTVTVVVCFKCHELDVQASRGGFDYYGEDFDLFLSLAKAAFPQDAQVQAL